MSRHPQPSIRVQLRLRWGDISNVPARLFVFLFDLVYQVIQIFLILLFKPSPPRENGKVSANPYGRIAVIGAGLSGVSSAAHCIAHNFDVVLYDRNPSVGGIWSHVNSTSGLQINSLVYRFHPAVFWREGFPKRDEILGEITRIWREYNLETRTKCNVEVVRVEPVSKTWAEDGKSERPSRSQWYVFTTGSDEPDGPYDAVICTIGTCGEPSRIAFTGTDDFEDAGGRVVHSSELDQIGAEGAPTEEHHNGDIRDKDDKRSEGGESLEGPDAAPAPDVLHAQPEEGVSYADKVKETSHFEVNGNSGGVSESGYDSENNRGNDKGSDLPSPLSVKEKTIAIIGSGASGVEAAEWAVEKGAKKILMLARDDKWIIPRNVVVDTMLAMQPFGREMPFSFIIEGLIRHLHYRDLAKSVAPRNIGFFAGTPVVNDAILNHIRAGTVSYIRCTTERLTSKGVLVKHYENNSEEELNADIVILATGFKRPSIDFLPKYLFPSGYDRPNLYLQNFPTEDWSILLTNASYKNAIGTVGHFHIGIYTRILLTFLLDEGARPRPEDMKLWVDVLRFIKRGAPGGALGFFTYMELTIWLFTFHLFRLDRLRWIFFIMQGWGVTADESGRLKVE